MATTVLFHLRCRRPSCGGTRVVDRSKFDTPRALRAEKAKPCGVCESSMTVVKTEAVDVKTAEVLATDE